MIRDAVNDDVPAIVEIYNDVVARTTAVWSDTLVTSADRHAWLAERHARGFPARRSASRGGREVRPQG